MSRIPLRPLTERGRALHPDQLHTFWRNGHLVVEDLLDSAIMDQLRDEYEVVCQEARSKGKFGNFAQRESAEDEAREVMAINQVCERNLFFNALLYNTQILDVVEDLISPNIQLFHDFILRKPDRHGVLYSGIRITRRGKACPLIISPVGSL